MAADSCSTSSPAVCPASDDAAVTHKIETSPVARLSTVGIRSACCGSMSAVSVDHSTDNRSITTSPFHTGQWKNNKSSSCGASNREVAVNCDVTGSETSFTDSVPCSSNKSTLPLSSKRKKKKSSRSACTTATIGPKDCEFTMTNSIQGDSKNPSMPGVVHECASPTTLKAKKKRKKKRSSAAVNENTPTMKAPPCDDQPVCATSNSSFPVSNFEQELEWCIAQLEMGLTRSGASKMQKIDNEKYVRLLRSGKSPLPRKRQLMKTLFGDYRSKMIKEPLQQGFPPPVSICAIREKGLVSSRGRFFKKSVHKDSGTHNGASVEGVSVMNKTKEVSPVFHFNFDMEA